MFEHLLHMNTVWDIFCPYLCVAAVKRLPVHQP